MGTTGSHTNEKCTEPAALSSGSPTDHSPKGVAARRALNLRRFQLGATATLGCGPGRVKSRRNPLDAICESFFLRSTSLRPVLRDLERSDQQFAEPGTLSSTSPADRPLPRSAAR